MKIQKCSGWKSSKSEHKSQSERVSFSNEIVKHENTKILELWRGMSGIFIVFVTAPKDHFLFLWFKIIMKYKIFSQSKTSLLFHL